MIALAIIIACAFFVVWVGIPILDHALTGSCWDCRWHERRAR